MAYGTGVVIPGWQAPKPKQGNDPYKAGILQGGQDYDDIMARYRAITNGPPNPSQVGLQNQYQNLAKGGNYAPTQLQYNQNSSQTYTPNPLKYQRSPELSSAFSNLSEYSRTGGISDTEGADIRARGISPIRSIYANAQQNLNRSRSLGGGYSPNYAASSTKMTRDLSEQLANASTNVEAGLADQRQRGRLAMAPQYASFAQRETEAMGDIDKQNESNRLSASSLNNDNRFRDSESKSRIDALNESNRLNAAQFNRQGQSEGLSGLMGLYSNQRDREMEALRGMQGMYGATPGLAQLYGSQAMQQRGLDQNETQMNNQSSQSLMQAYNNRKPRYGSVPRLG